MAKKTFLVDIDLARNELQNATIQNLTSDPTAVAADVGLIYYNSASKKLRIYDGSGWADVGKDVDTSNFVVGPGTSGGGNLPYFSNTSGKVLADSGVTISSVSAHVADATKHITSNQNAALDANTSLSSSVAVADKPWVALAVANSGDVKASGISEDEDIPMYSGTSGKIIKTTGISKSQLSNAVGVAHLHGNKAELDKVTTGDVGKWNMHVGLKDNPHGVTKAQVGLSNVNNTSDSSKPISNAVQTELNKALHKDGSVTMTGHLKMGTKKVTGLANGTGGADAVTVSQLNVAISGVTGGVTYKEGYNASMDLPPLESGMTGIRKGWMYAVTTAGTFYGTHLSVGNTIISKRDDPTTGDHWTLIQGDLDHASTTNAGIVELATSQEVAAGASTSLVVTPSGLSATLEGRAYAVMYGKVVPDGALTATISQTGIEMTNANIVVTNDLGDEYQFRIKRNSSNIVLTSNTNIPAGLTAYVQGTVIT